MPHLSPKRAPKPLDSAKLEELALAYVARFATSAAKLEAFLRRKLRERGWAEEREPALAALIERFVRAGYIDDRAFALARGSSLLRRGYGRRRIDEALGAAGIAEDLREEARGNAGAQRKSALALARKRGLGPFSRVEPDRRGLDRREKEKQVAALLRAGHPLDSARRIVDAGTIAELEDWAAAYEED